MVFDPTINSGQTTTWGWNFFHSMHLAIENDDANYGSNSTYTIKKFYIKNVISNPQEVNNHENFIIHFDREYLQQGANNEFANLNQYINHPNVEGVFGEVGSIPLHHVFTPTDYNIPYPSYYEIQPGNVEYSYLNSAGGFVINFPASYKFPYEFDLEPGEMFHFRLRFSPQVRKIDFYRADLVLNYTKHGEDFVYEKVHKIRADVISEVNSIDGKVLNTQVLTVNGISSGNILLAQ